MILVNKDLVFQNICGIYNEFGPLMFTLSRIL